jgi:hypothetical protein
VAEGERNRTALAQMNAEIRREKAKIKAQIPELKKMSKKKARAARGAAAAVRCARCTHRALHVPRSLRGVGRSVQALSCTHLTHRAITQFTHCVQARKLPEDKKKERVDKIEAIERDLDAVPDGTAPERRKRRDRLLEQNGPITINVDVNSMTLNPQSMEHSAESTAFRNEYMLSKAKQDQGLDQISKGLRTLKDMGHAMNDELKKQDPLLDNIDTKATDATAELRTANTKLKALLLEMRQPHKLCLDLILVSVLLGIGSYIFTMVKPGATSNATSGVTAAVSKIGRRRLLEALLGDSGAGADSWPTAAAVMNDPAVLRLLQ